MADFVGLGCIVVVFPLVLFVFYPTPAVPPQGSPWGEAAWDPGKPTKPTKNNETLTKMQPSKTTPTKNPINLNSSAVGGGERLLKNGIHWFCGFCWARLYFVVCYCFLLFLGFCLFFPPCRSPPKAHHGARRPGTPENQQKQRNN